MGASYPDGWTWRKVGDRRVVVGGPIAGSAERLATCSAGRGVAGASFVADVGVVDAAGTSWLCVDPVDPSQRAA